MTQPTSARPQQRLRVLITTPVFSPDFGGPAGYVPSLGRFPVERGHTVQVACFTRGYPTGDVTVDRLRAIEGERLAAQGSVGARR